MNWGTFLAVVLGGAVTIVAQGVQTFWSNRAEVRRRADQAAEEARTVVAELRRAAMDEPPNEVSARLDDQMTRDYLPRLRLAAGYLSRRAVREEMEELITWLDRWTSVRNFGGVGPGQARWLIMTRIDQLLSAYRRHERRLPTAPSFEETFRSALQEEAHVLNQLDEDEAKQRRSKPFGPS